MVQRPNLVGQQFGSYRLLRLLGAGGFADVYLGEHIDLGTQAAIKVLHTQLSPADIDAFRTEARTIARLLHPHIIRVLDFNAAGSTPFLVMDYAVGGTTRERYPKGTILPLATVVSYIQQVTEALQYAHDEKFIHRDIKPENILLDRHENILLSDFGIALVAQSSRYQSTQEVIGTAAYMSPEQIQGKPRPQSDQYALGIVVYEWLSGTRPFEGSLTELWSQHMFAPPPPLREKVPTISKEVEHVVMTALAKDPKQRFGNVRAFATALRQASESGQEPTILSPQPEPEAAAVVPVSETTETTRQEADKLEEERSAKETALAPTEGAATAPQTALPAQLPSPSTPGQNKRRLDPAVTISLILVALIFVGILGIAIYAGVTQSHPPTSAQLYGVAWSGSQFVAVGSGGTILTSPDGHTWTTQTSGTSNSLRGVAWSGSQFVAVGDNGTILTSPDGRTWTTQFSGTSDYFNGVVWSGSQFVAVGDKGPLISPDGSTWRLPTFDISYYALDGVAWSGSQFVAVGSGGTILTSPNGYTWTTPTSPASNTLNGVAWSGSQFVAVGNNGTILTSPDGSTWTTQTSGDSSSLNGVAGSGSQFVAVGDDGILTSSDGHTWTTPPSSTSNSLNGVIWSGSRFVAVGWWGTILTSPNGSTWTT